jgi:hypothetical protein
LIFALVPTVLIIIALCFCVRFPLTAYTHAVCMAEVKRRRKEPSRDLKIGKKEKEEILKKLVGKSFRLEGE